MTMPDAPIMVPIERSNSPAIISSETGTARMPSSAATCRYAAVPLAVSQPEPPATIAKKIQTATAPATAPSSGLATSLRSMLCRSSRSSAIGCPAGVGAAGAWGADAPPLMLHSPPKSPDALRAEGDDAGRGVLGHQAGPGQDGLAAARG